MLVTLPFYHTVSEQFCSVSIYISLSKRYCLMHPNIKAHFVFP